MAHTHTKKNEGKIFVVWFWCAVIARPEIFLFCCVIYFMRDARWKTFFVGCFLFSLDNLRFKLMAMAMTMTKIFTSWKINSATKIIPKKKWSIHICVVEPRIYLDTVPTVIWLFSHMKNFWLIMPNNIQTMWKKKEHV